MTLRGNFAATSLAFQSLANGYRQGRPSNRILTLSGNITLEPCGHGDLWPESHRRAGCTLHVDGGGKLILDSGAVVSSTGTSPYQHQRR